jgi:hypothetical protein
MTSGWRRARINLTDLASLDCCVIRNPSKEILEVKHHLALYRLGNLDFCNDLLPTLVLTSIATFG